MEFIQMTFKVASKAKTKTKAKATATATATAKTAGAAKSLKKSGIAGPAPYDKEKSRITKEEWREYTKTVWSIANTSHKEHPAVFPLQIPHRLTKLFSFYGETVLDPFAGTGTTARAAIPLGRRAVCVDQNPGYVKIINKECATLHNGHCRQFESLLAVHGDSRNLDFLSSDSVGLVVTSPPYWNKADYGSRAENLGSIESYGEFLEGIRPVFEECYRVLKPGRKLCVDRACRTHGG